MSELSPEATNFGWLLDNFVQTVPGTRHTLVVSADGLLMAMSKNLDRTGADTLAAVVSGMASLTRGAARELHAGQVRQSIIEMDDLFLFLMTVSNGAVAAVAADSTCAVGLVGYEMTLLVSRTESLLTPQLITELRRPLPPDGRPRVSPCTSPSRSTRPIRSVPTPSPAARCGPRAATSPWRRWCARRRAWRPRLCSPPSVDA